MLGSYGADVYSVDVRAAGQAAGTPYRLWLGDSTKRIHIVRYQLGSYGTSPALFTSIRRSLWSDLTLTAGVAHDIYNLSNAGVAVPAGVKAYTSSGADNMATAASLLTGLSFDLAANGDTWESGMLPKGFLTVDPGYGIGVLIGTADANIGIKAGFLFIVE